MIIIFVSFVIFLFAFYVLVKDDFVYLRKNVTPEDLFTAVFLSVPIVLVAARVGYILLHPKWMYLNPFVFFLISYFPGLFIGTGILGEIIFLYVYTKNKKIPFLRLFDEVGLAFLLGTSVYFFLIGIQQWILHVRIGIVDIIIGILYYVGYTLSKSLFLKEKWRDGSIGAFAVMLCCLFSLLFFTSLLLFLHGTPFGLEEIVYIVLLVVSVGFFVKIQYLLKKVVRNG